MCAGGVCSRKIYMSAKAKKLTRLQTATIISLIVLSVVLGINAMVTYGSDRAPSETMFQNSQTLQMISV